MNQNEGSGHINSFFFASSGKIKNVACWFTVGGGGYHSHSKVAWDHMRPKIRMIMDTPQWVFCGRQSMKLESERYINLI